MVYQRSEIFLVADDPLWYKDAVIYELHVRAFFDSDGDGVGDILGLIEKLDYLQDLGITAIWLLPFYPSPLRDDGYDISNYTDILPIYGDMSQFKTLVEEAHRRGLRVITELVLNHTSDQHPWFQRARRSPPDSRWRNYYVWSDTTDKYKEARIIFIDTESSNWAWDPVAKAYYWHRFYSHQPDLNFNSPDVRSEVMRIVDFWLSIGVDGLRADAVPYLYERDGTNSENLPETHAYIMELRRHIDSEFRNRLLVAEANQWPEDASAYFGNADEFHIAFHFPLMPRMFMAIRMEDRFPIIDILEQTPSIPETCQWALFLRNHDELTLEMVTDEERDYMYRMYARDPAARLNLGIRRRLAPLLNNDRKKIELMNGLLFSLPGTPVIYYGDEIGMGDNIYLGDRNGVRTPMQWSPDRNAGFSRTNPQRLYLPPIIDPEYNYEAVNVENQQHNRDSLVWWMKRVIATHRRFKAFGRGSITFLPAPNRKILAYIRRYQEEIVLVVANLASTAQETRLDLSEFTGRVPVELFGTAEFFPISDQPYCVTLGPYGFYWFSLEAAPITLRAAPPKDIPTIPKKSEEIFKRINLPFLSQVISDYITARRWFRGKARHISYVEITDDIPIGLPETTAHILFVQINYSEGESEVYMLPLVVIPAEPAKPILAEYPQALIARLLPGDDAAGPVLCDAVYYKDFCLTLLEAIYRHRGFKGEIGTLSALPMQNLATLYAPEDSPLEPRPVKTEQTNTSVVYGDRLILKLFRRIEEGPNPDLEIDRFLTEKTDFTHMPPTAGTVEYSYQKGAQPSTIAFLQGFVRNEGDAWEYTLETLNRYFQYAVTHPTVQVPPVPTRPLLTLGTEIPSLAQETIGTYLESVRLLGQRTAEMHQALASDPDDPDFAPEPFTLIYQNSLYHRMRSFVNQVLLALQENLSELPEDIRREAQAVLQLEKNIIARYRLLSNPRISTKRIRCHGDFHLGQVLYTGKDFVIIDFEGEPARPSSERRLKRCPLIDVAGMIRSFDYAASTALARQAGSLLRPEDIRILEQWARFWYTWVSATYISAYMELIKDTGLLPEETGQTEILLNAYLLDKAIYEVGYELNNRPEWIRVPLRGVLNLMEVTD